jgi:hypothetical protein
MEFRNWVLPSLFLAGGKVRHMPRVDRAIDFAEINRL